MMLQFSSFSNALRYQLHCPICKSKLEPDRYKHAYYDDGGTKISCLMGDDFNISIDLDTEKVEIILDRPKSYLTNNISSYNPYSTTPPSYNYNGQVLQGLKINCNDCFQYSYTLQVHIDLTAAQLTKVFLNSEVITTEDKTGVHELHNNYSLDKTYYRYYPKHHDSIIESKNAIEIPVIPLNLQNPLETISRVKNLVIFS